MNVIGTRKEKFLARNMTPQTTMTPSRPNPIRTTPAAVSPPVAKSVSPHFKLDVAATSILDENTGQNANEIGI